MILALAQLAIFATVVSHAHEPNDCPKLGSVYKSMCPSHVERTLRVTNQGIPGKKGVKGEKGKVGVQGIKGTKGDLGEPDYDRVEELIAQRLQVVSDEQSRKYSEMSNLLMAANEKIRILENKRVYCPVEYDGKCFWIEVRYNWLTSIQKAREICGFHGGQPANIYSEDHYYMIMGYLRMFSSKDWGTHAWLGMTFNRQTNAVLLTNGTVAPFVKWHPGNPSCSNSCSVNIKAHMDWKDTHQHMWTAKSPQQIRAVICEK